MKIDICIPTYDANPDVFRETLRRLQRAMNYSPFEANRIRFDYKPTDTDQTKKTIFEELSTDWLRSTYIDVTDHNLPEARQFLMSQVTTDWFLFLDDDVWLTASALRRLAESLSPAAGGVGVRRLSDPHSAAKWSVWRPVRGTLFASLIRTEAVEDIAIPADITVLEDQYIREHIENNGYLWLFDHRAKFKHLSRNRHSIDFNEGRIAGKYDLLPIWYVFGNVTYNPVNWRHYERALGYVKGRWLE